jgi:(1->4)-alpha-D-glucan 1-alpha-D-glucosylmutase
MTADVPASTYRLQFHRGFTFRDAAALIPYLAALGVEACYASPYLKATPGTLHGYDICDHNALNPDLGDESDYQTFVDALKGHGMGQILDFVPNHMGIDPRTNTWWRDVLENGPSSPFATHFDIDWKPVTAHLEYKVLLPILGDQYGLELERGRFRLVFADGSLHLHYYDHVLPLNPRQSPRILRHDLDHLRESLGEEDADLREFLSILTALQNLPPYTEDDPQLVEERHREKEVARERLARLVAHSEPIAAHVHAAVERANGDPSDPASFDLLHELLDVQAFRLAYWRTAFDEINYRRFFDVNELAGLRMEDEQVFEHTHGLLRQLLASGAVTGVRVDHPDGLFDPAQYFQRLQALARDALRERNPEAGSTERPLYLLAEKIISPGERQPDWAIHGTTGYEFLNDLNGLFVDGKAARSLRRIYTRIARQAAPFAEVAWEGKRVIMRTTMVSELNVLADVLNRLTEEDRRTRDFTLNALRRALLQVVAAFPIYRTYISPAGESAADRDAIEHAVAEARRRDPTTESSIYAFVRRMLLPFEDDQTWTERPEHGQRLHFAMRFQQYTGPVQAKGVEDTAFYRYNTLISLNEVGGEPARIGVTPADFHRSILERQQRWPWGMTTTATHDTKRGEDARARINVISEVPDLWRKAVGQWMRMNAGQRSLVNRLPAPDRNDEYHFYQALAAAWPAEVSDAPLPTRATDEFVSRLRGYMQKATREAKVHTSWVNPSSEYDDAITRFVERVLAGPVAARFLASFVPLQRRLARAGAMNGLAQVLLKIAAPGVPDIYQGGELWDLSLVDPDNRRPVDFEARRRLLAALQPALDGVESGAEVTATVGDLLAAWPDGRIKLWVTACALRHRRRRRDLYLNGAYEPLDAVGPHAEHVVAFARRHGDETVVAAVPRLGLTLSPEGGAALGAAWLTTWLNVPDATYAVKWCNLLTGDRFDTRQAEGTTVLALGDVFRTCPVALLVPLNE